MGQYTLYSLELTLPSREKQILDMRYSTLKELRKTVQRLQQRHKYRGFYCSTSARPSSPPSSPPPSSSFFGFMKNAASSLREAVKRFDEDLIEEQGKEMRVLLAQVVSDEELLKEKEVRVALGLDEEEAVLGA